MSADFFGPKITDYVIVVFTGGDNLEEGDPRIFKAILLRTSSENSSKFAKTNVFCLTKEDEKKELQVQMLMSLVENVIEKNGSRPYTDNVFAKYKESTMLQQTKEEANASTDLLGKEEEEFEQNVDQKTKKEEKKFLTAPAGHTHDARRQEA